LLMEIWFKVMEIHWSKCVRTLASCSLLQNVEGQRAAAAAVNKQRVKPKEEEVTR